MDHRPPQRYLDFLAGHGVDDMGHTDHGLLAHLEGTYGLLRAWGYREAVCVGGLFHSVYGTESYKGELIPHALRPEVQALIGEEAERLAYLFGVLVKDTFYANLDLDGDFRVMHRQDEAWIPISAQEFTDQCGLSVANWLEQHPRVPERYKRIRTDEFRKMRPWLKEGAREALDGVYGFGDEG